MEEQIAADPLKPPEALPAAAAVAALEVDGQVAAAVTSAFTRMKGVVESCALAGLTAAQALAVLTPEATAETTRDQILAQRRANGGREIASHVLPEDGILDPEAVAKGQGTDPNNSAVVKAVEKMFPAGSAKGGN